MREEVFRMERVTRTEHGIVKLEDFQLQIYKGEILGLIPINAHGLRSFLELKAGHLNHTVHFWLISDVDAFINGQTCDLSQIVIAMSADRADAIGGETDAFRIPSIDGRKLFLTKHAVKSHFR